VSPTISELRAELERMEARGLGSAPVFVDDGDQLWRSIYHVGTRRNSKNAVVAVLDIRELDYTRR
jgi:hypothetical protein